MAKPGALLLLLAVVASQVDLSLLSKDTFNGSGVSDISSCPITLLGKTYKYVEVTANPVEICFKSSRNEIKVECFTIGNSSPSHIVAVEDIRGTTSPGSFIHQAVPNIKSVSTCYVYIELYSPEIYYMDFYVYNFGKQAVMRVKKFFRYTWSDLNVFLSFNSSVVRSWYFTPFLPGSGVAMDISGCRISDPPYFVNSTYEEMDPETCSKEVCDSSAVLRNVSSCGYAGACQGNNTCLPITFVCTVTGSTVIDFFNRNHSVSDRCVYTLMKPQESQDFKLLAGFRERRRKDVPFLDHLIVWLEESNVTLYLEQGGRVRFNDSIQTLNATAQVVYDVELRKDKNGVTVKLPFSNMTIFFDGNTAHLSGNFEAVEGLCGDLTVSNQTTTPLDEKSSSYSPNGCETQYNDTFDNTINCTRTTEHCNLMNQAPFTDCHDNLDPASYIAACTNTLCNYPAVDGLICQFLEAYAKACSLKTNKTMGDWRTKTSCSVLPQAFCLDQYCSDHEFCALKYNESRCLCRAIFASRYRESNNLGEPTVCMQNSASITLVGCLLEDYNVDYSTLHLKDKNCTGQMDNETHMLTFSFDNENTCGTEVQRINSEVIFKNTIMSVNSSTTAVITYSDQFLIDFSCLYTEPNIQTLFFKIKQSSVVKQIKSGAWNYNLMMNAYTDFGRRNLIKPTTEIRLNQQIWVELKTAGLENSMVTVLTNSCWATKLQSPNDTLKHNLISNGCPNPHDQTVTVSRNGVGTSTFFSFNMFAFSGGKMEIYLHCKVELCPKQNNSCAPNCGGGSRKRRSSRSEYADENPGLITMAWGI